MSYLHCQDINKAFGAVIALKDATFSVEKGEIHAILGGNGSGKSTLAKIIGGSVFADGGEILIDGHKVRIKSPIHAKELGIAVTSQELSLFNHLTVEENLVLLDKAEHLKLFRSPQKASERVKIILSRMGLDDTLKQKMSDLPENKKYLIEFAKAIHYDPKILIVDEITSALYREEVELIKEILNEMARKGCAIIFISHRLQEIYAISTQVTVMRNGQVVNTHSLTDCEDILIQEMIGHDSVLAGADLKEKKDASQKQESKETLISLKDFTIPGFMKPINLEIEKGEMIGIAGLQGQGQSQLMRTLFGINRPVSVVIEGVETKIDSPRQAIKNGFAYLSGDRKKEGVYYGRSIYENIKDVTMQVLHEKNFDEDELMKQFGVKYKSKSQAIETLSGGNQQKVVTARWVGIRPKLLLADDPTKGIDVVARSDVHQIFADMVDEGASVVMSSSDDDELVKIASKVSRYKVLVMYDGQIVAVLQGKDINISNIITTSMPRGEQHE